MLFFKRLIDIPNKWGTFTSHHRRFSLSRFPAARSSRPAISMTISNSRLTSSIGNFRSK
jgi:hypothetical protein